MGSGASKPNNSNPILDVNTVIPLEEDFVDMGIATHNNQGGVQIRNDSDIKASKEKIMELLKENYTIDNDFLPENISDEEFVKNINELWRKDRQGGGGGRRKRKTRRKKKKNSTRKRNRNKRKSKKRKKKKEKKQKKKIK